MAPDIRAFSHPSKAFFFSFPFYSSLWRLPPQPHMYPNSQHRMISKISPEYYPRELHVLLHWVHRYLKIVVLVPVKVVLLEEVGTGHSISPPLPILTFYLEPQTETSSGI